MDDPYKLEEHGNELFAVRDFEGAINALILAGRL